MTHCNGHSQLKMCEQKGFLCDSLYHITASMMRIFLLFSSQTIFYGGGVAREDGRYEGTYDVKDTKNKKKSLKKSRCTFLATAPVPWLPTMVVMD